VTPVSGKREKCRKPYGFLHLFSWRGQNSLFDGQEGERMWKKVRLSRTRWEKALDQEIFSNHQKLDGRRILL
jgi:hypothetical protein